MSKINTMYEITAAEDAGNRALAIRLAADAAGDDRQARLAVIRQALSDRRMDVAPAAGDLARFVAECWAMGINPLPAFRKRLGPTWIVVAHCYASHEEVTPDDYKGELFLEVPVNATGVQFRRV